MNDYLHYAKKVLLSAGILFLCILVPYLIYKTFIHFVPFILAYFTALMLEPLTVWLGKRFNLSAKPSIIITYLAFLGSLAFLFIFLASKIYVQSLDLFFFIQNNLAVIQAWLLQTSKNIYNLFSLLPPNTVMQFNESLDSLISNFANIDIFTTVGTYTLNLSTAIPNFFFSALIYFISIFLFQMNLNKIHNRFYSFFNTSSKKKVLLVTGDLRQATFGFLKAQLIMSTLTYILSYVGLNILNIKYAYVIAFFIIIVDVLPILGVGSVFLPWALIVFLQGKSSLAIGLLILFLIIVIIRRIIEPKILGESIGLSALATLISIWIGFKTIGLIGIFIFPLALIFFKALVKVGFINLDFKL